MSRRTAADQNQHLCLVCASARMLSSLDGYSIFMLLGLMRTMTMRVMMWFLMPILLPVSKMLRWSFSFSKHSCTQDMVATVALALMMTEMSFVASTTCPSNCSTLSPLPYPFGAKPGCGSPGFQLSDCSIPVPLWNLTLAGTPHPYYISSIGPNPNHSNPQAAAGLTPNYGYGGTVVLLLNYTISVPSLCEFRPPRLGNLTTTNFYAFEDADLTFYQDHYLMFNCTASVTSHPDSGVLTPSSPSCTKFMSYCNLTASRNCLDYVPDKELQLIALSSAYGCSTLKRFIIADVDASVSTWIPATQFAWGPVQHADSCSSCQSSGGECGYDVQDHSNFQCYCGDGIHAVNCHEGSGKRIGIGVGVSIAALFLLVSGGIVCYRRYKYVYYTMFTRERLNLDGINLAPLEFPYGALAAATKSFRSLIGQGAFGKVYLGVLPDGSEVAVKVLDPSMSHTDEQFLNEVATIGNIHHMNVARLVGFCIRRSKRILVYEYVSNGSLEKYLFASKSEVVLSWKQRYDIALGVARGLYYMHEECRNCIIHCDIKPQNILLDTAFCPKISDFGLARLLAREESRVVTHARGTPGYVAPEFWSLGTGPLTAKFDVYSYGMVLLEIIRGKRCFEMLDPVLQGGREDEQEGWMSSVCVDKQVEDPDMEQVKMCTRVALWCIQDDPALRPTMNRVVQYLQGTAPVPDNPPKPFKRIFQSQQDYCSQAPTQSSDFTLRSSSRGALSLGASRDDSVNSLAPPFSTFSL